MEKNICVYMYKYICVHVCFVASVVSDFHDPMDCSLPGSSVHGDSSKRILKWVGETMETVTDFIFLGSKITADGDCSPEIKRCLLFGRKTMTNIDSILKSRELC